MSDTPQANLTDERESRLKKLSAFREKGVTPYPNIYKPGSFSADVKAKFAEDETKEFNANVAGRIMFSRDFGKARFCSLKDDRGTIQVYGRKDVLGEDAYALFKLLDMGDIIGAEGKVFKTHTGEVTINVERFTLLAKAVNALPEKWHGLSDMETRYRQRYVDLIVNDDVKRDFIVRSKVVTYIRNFLTQKAFLEVETPMMQAIPGGATARPFVTHHNALDMDLYLRIAPELFLKRLIVGGFERVFELNRNFRNEGIDTRHNPEFTMLELYQSYADYRDMMSLFEELMAGVAKEIKGDTKFEYQGATLDFGNWKKVKWVDAIKEYAGVDCSAVKSAADAVAIARQKGIDVKGEGAGKWTVLNLLFDEFAEEKLQEPTIIYEFPSEISPLAKYKQDDPEFTERFEPYAVGRELGNAFSELNDPFVQKERFLEQVKRKSTGDDEAMFMDEDYVTALEYGMPPTGGMGIGIDRLVMLLVDTNSIRDTILFPTLKPR
jgi:lysyl-tRNA synthetase class 2